MALRKRVGAVPGAVALSLVLLPVGPPVCGLAVTVADRGGAASAVSGPAFARVDLTADLLRAAEEHRLVVREERGGNGTSSLPAQFVASEADAGTGTVWWLMPPGPSGSRSFEIRAVADCATRIVHAEPSPDEKSVRVRDGDLPVLLYHHGSSPLPPGVPAEFRRGDYIHPLYGPDGEVLTEDFPKDHYHHRALMWSWAVVRWKGQVRDPYALRGMWHRPVDTVRVRSGPVFAAVRAESRWMWEDKTPVVREQVVVRAYRSTKRRRFLDIDITLTALVDDLQIGGRPGRGYSGLCLRMAAADRPGTTELYVEPAASAVQRAWASYSNTPSGVAASSGVVLLQCDGNPRYPAEWIEYPELFWIQPAFPGQELFSLPKERPVELRFRLWIHPGEAGSEVCGQLWTSYNRPPSHPPRLALDHLSQYREGQSRRALVAFECRFSSASPERRKAMERDVLELLGSSSTSVDAKRWCCRVLSRRGTSEAVPTLAGLLADTDVGGPARNALEDIPHPTSAKALRDGLASLAGQAKIGVINSLGVRGDREAARALAVLAAADDAAAAGAAVTALGAIGGEECLKLLESTAVRRDLAEARDHALLAAAHSLEGGEAARRRAAVFGRLLKEGASDAVRRAALRGLAGCGGDAAAETVLDLLREGPPPMREAAARLVSVIPGPQVGAAAAEILPVLQPPLQVTLLHALAERGDRAARGRVAEIVGSEDAEARAAALGALGVLGDARDVPALVAAATGPVPVGVVAAGALTRLDADGVDAALLRLAATASETERVQAIRALGERGCTAALPALMGCAGAADTSVRREAFEALGKVAGEDDVQQLLALFLGAPADTQRAARGACSSLAERTGTRDAAVEAAAVLCRDGEATDRVRLFELLGDMGGENALGPVVAGLGCGVPEVRAGAVRTLARWPTVGAAEPLLSVARAPGDLALRVLALRGVVRLLKESDMPGDRKAQLYRRALAAAQRAEEKRLVLSGLAGESGFPALEAAASCLDQAELTHEAARAVVAIALPGDASPGLTTKAVESILERARGHLTDAKDRSRVDAYLDDLPVLRNRSVAEGKPAKGSVRHQGGSVPAMAVDGKVSRTSYWSGETTPAWWEVDLHEAVDIGHIKVVFYWDGTRYYQYRIDASVDGKTWNTVVDGSANTEVSTADGFTHRLASVSARYVRVHILKNSANPGAHIVEFMVFRTEGE